MRRVTPNQIPAFNMRRLRKEREWDVEKACQELEQKAGIAWRPPTWWAAEGSWRPGARVRVFDVDLLAALARTFGVGINDLLVPPSDEDVMVALKDDPGQPWSRAAWLGALVSASGREYMLDFRRLADEFPEFKDTFNDLAVVARQLSQRLHLKDEVERTIMKKFYGESESDSEAASENEGGQDEAGA